MIEITLDTTLGAAFIGTPVAACEAMRISRLALYRTQEISWRHGEAYE